MKCGRRKLISKNASGYSFGRSISFHTFDGGGISGGAGMNLFAAFGAVPPGFPRRRPGRSETAAPARLASRRDCRPRRCARHGRKTPNRRGRFRARLRRAPADRRRLLWRRIPACTGHRLCFRIGNEDGKVCGSSGCSSRRYSSQLTHLPDELPVEEIFLQEDVAHGQ